MTKVSLFARPARDLFIGMMLVALAASLAACGGSSAAAPAPPAGNTPPPPPVVIQGVATPTSVAVVTATNAQ